MLKKVGAIFSFAIAVFAAAVGGQYQSAGDEQSENIALVIGTVFFLVGAYHVLTIRRK
jgi:hypothetical protein